MARGAGLDLVEVAPQARPPVCRIMDYGKWRYQQQKKQDKSHTHKGGKLKQLNIDTTRIGEHDLGIKINHAREFLKEGNKVQFTLRFKGRELAHIDLGRALFNRVKEELFLVSKIERDSKMEGKRMTMVLQPDHKSPDAKPPVKGGVAPKPAAGAPAPVGGPRPLVPGAPRPVAAGAPNAPVAARPVAVAPRPAVANPAGSSLNIPAPAPKPQPAGA